MSIFRMVIWYVGVFIVALSLLLSYLTNNWLLAGVCAFVTAILKSKNKDIQIPKLYREKGISNTYFKEKGKHEKNN